MSEPFVVAQRFEVVTGHEFWDDWNLKFPGEAKTIDPFYRTVFGPAFSTNAVIYADNNYNLSFMMRRLLKNRFPDDPAKEWAVRSAQAAFIGAHQELFARLRIDYFDQLDQHLDLEEEIQAHIQDPHPKKLLREHAWEELHTTGTLSSQTWLKTKRGFDYVTVKLKREEYAKFGKIPRAVMDLSVSASLLGFRLMEYLKRAQEAEPFYFNGGYAAFCKSPDPVTLQKHFDNLYEPPGRFYFLYFSDDSCLSVRDRSGRVIRYNIDISTCDASHTSALFDLLESLMPLRLKPICRRLILQCMAPLKIASRAFKKHKTYIRPLWPFLYSGSTLTTAINNLANLLIAIAISESSDPSSTAAIIAAALNAGYVVTCQLCETFEEVQFLKHSPVLDVTSRWRPILNIGVLLRLSGVCKRDLPGRGDLRKRAQAFQTQLIQGLYPRVSFPLIDMLRTTHCVKFDPRAARVAAAAVEELLSFKVAAPLHDTWNLTTEDVFRRYRLLPGDAQSLTDLFGSAPVFTAINHPAASQILSLDYGLITCLSNPAADPATEVAEPRSLLR